jgi:predicted esterase/catechol 2,3-dioxygenase-like lactoylglutathione lyase family enzyme
MQATGIHHVTAIGEDAQANRDFWAGVLGLRAVKKTVNFDDPQTYHLYYGDETGSPGTILTFFPYKGARQGRIGQGQAAMVALAVPAVSMDWWATRLTEAAVSFEQMKRGGVDALAFEDPDGLPVELVGEATATGWSGGTVPAEHAIERVAGVELQVADPAPTRAVLERLGFTSESPTRMTSPRGWVDFATGNGPGVGGAGTIHHVAFRVGDDEAELTMRAKILEAGLQPTEVIDRQYFHSVYFREPGGVLFELATDPPGFDADEPVETLGESLKLPPQVEAMRDRIEQGIRPLVPPVDGPTFVHLWRPGGDRTLVTLHGTGGDENDLLPLATKVMPNAAVLSPRGRVLERGAPRFFRRLAEGVFDEGSVVREANALTDFLANQADRYGFDAGRLDALGYSNGANVASAAVLLRPGTFRRLALLRPMVPLKERRPDPLPDLTGTSVLLLGGRRDPIAPPPEVAALRDLLEEAGATVDLHDADAGHELTGGDIEAVRAFIAG